jgi:hypothetical protein
MAQQLNTTPVGIYARANKLSPVQLLDLLLDLEWHSLTFNREAYILLYNASMHLQDLEGKVKPHDWQPERWGLR